MIRNAHKLAELEKSFYRNEAPDYRRSLALFEAMWREGMGFGVLPPRDPMEGLETVLKLARILGSCSKNSSQN